MFKCWLARIFHGGKSVAGAKKKKATKKK